MHSRKKACHTKFAERGRDASGCLLSSSVSMYIAEHNFDLSDKEYEFTFLGIF